MTDVPKLTPMMEQYLEVKGDYPDYILLYRIGDFYECFFDDAVKASKALSIQLTAHGSSAKHEGDPPMCGIPFHAFSAYIPRLIRAGFKVAVCEQQETPEEARAARGSKAMIRREVTRIITSGTLTEDELLSGTSGAGANWLMTIVRAEDGGYGAAWADVSTGESGARSLSGEQEAASFAAVKNPAEIVAAEGLLAGEQWRAFGEKISCKPASFFDPAGAGIRVRAEFGVLQGFSPAEITALGAALAYIELTYLGGQRPRLSPPVPSRESGKLALDSFCVRNLEIFENMTDKRGASLFSIMDRTKTAAGRRLLAARLQEPLADVSAINARLDQAAFFFDRAEACEGVRAILTRIVDVERILARARIGRASPRDMRSLGVALAHVPDLREKIEGAPFPEIRLGRELASKLLGAIIAEAPASTKDPDFISEGFDAALDEFRSLKTGAKRLMAELQGKYALEAGVPLKIKYNALSGYYIEVAPKHAEAMLAKGFRHRQSLANAARFSTKELVELEENLLGAEGKCRATEMRVFEGLMAEAAAKAEEILAAAKIIAEVDVASALAHVARAKRWVRPMVDDSLAFEVTLGRHPMVEEALGHARGRFIPNDAKFGDSPESSRLWLLTGPNMAGKSTFLRQNAIIAIMAQVGSFVPAASARIGVVDKLFSRVGASDNLAQGLSTFMVEMSEAAAILQQATERSFVILDELGRGTATFDGLAIAWAVLEDLSERIGCRGLFATHYHEIGEAAGKLKNLSPHTMSVKEYKGEVVFMHKVEPGLASHSYGIYVARLAGVPSGVVARAKEILANLEASAARIEGDNVDLFSYKAAGAAKAEGAAKGALDALREKLGAMEPDLMSPKEALEALYELKNQAKDSQ